MCPLASPELFIAPTVILRQLVPPMPNEPALIVRHEPRRTEAAIVETRAILAAIGEPDAIVRETSIPGNLKVLPEGDVHEAQLRVAELRLREPERFTLTSRWTAADAWVPSDLASIRRAVAMCQRDIRPGDSWRVSVRHKGGTLGTHDVLDAVTPLIPTGPVDLVDPAKEVRIDILGDETAVGLVGRDERFGRQG